MRCEVKELNADNYDVCNARNEMKIEIDDVCNARNEMKIEIDDVCNAKNKGYCYLQSVCDESILLRRGRDFLRRLEYNFSFEDLQLRLEAWDRLAPRIFNRRVMRQFLLLLMKSENEFIEIAELFMEVAESLWGFKIAKEFALGNYSVNKLLALKMSVGWVENDSEKENAVLELVRKRKNLSEIMSLFREVAESPWGLEIAKNFAMGDYSVNKLLALKMSVEWVGDDVERKNAVLTVVEASSCPNSIMPLFMEVAESSWGLKIAKKSVSVTVLKVLRMSAEWG